MSPSGYYDWLDRPESTHTRCNRMLTEKTIISFKGAKIEVLEANNIQIKYKVIKGFSNE